MNIRGKSITIEVGHTDALGPIVVMREGDQTLKFVQASDSYIDWHLQRGGWGKYLNKVVQAFNDELDRKYPVTEEELSAIQKKLREELAKITVDGDYFKYQG